MILEKVSGGSSRDRQGWLLLYANCIRLAMSFCSAGHMAMDLVQEISIFENSCFLILNIESKSESGEERYRQSLSLKDGRVGILWNSPHASSCFVFES